MPFQREPTKRAAGDTRSEIKSHHIERLLSIDPARLDLTKKRKTCRKDLQLPLGLLAGAIAALVGGGLAIGGVDIVAGIFGERSFNHLLVQSVLNGAAVLILLSPLVGFGLSTGPARNALCSLIDWLLEEEIGRARAYVQKVEEEEGLLWRFLEEEAEVSLGDSLGDERWRELSRQSREGCLNEMDVQGYRRAVLFLQSRWRQDKSLSKSEPCAERQREGEEEV
ncbi:hypothetical protein BSZ35_17935 [Salinibacter sp. 10B]|uniref:hypothetical protein n=1 Tax=Salinibacter sp. 10B TaxID=1923971 RepID=UPI000CF55732|nr:hypothetical protein [Salinibacter sp. 10B]PQJ26815.1 hypothetical protein BSZ35_17935 [Salinibacter sp. 10B]